MGRSREANLTPRQGWLPPLLVLLTAVGALHAAPGDLDSTFGVGGAVRLHLGPALADEFAHTVAVQGDGKVLLGGYVNTSHGLVRLNSDGTPDMNFGSGGKVVASFGFAPDAGIALALQPDGKILEAGSDFSVVRYDTNGNLDPSLGGTGRVATQLGTVSDMALAMAVQTDGKIVLGGYSQVIVGQDYDQTFALVRFNPEGSLDDSFSGDGKLTTDLGDRIDRCTGLACQDDGRIVAAGYSGASWALVRYDTDGTLDPTFGGDGKVLTAPWSGTSVPNVALQPDGKILLAGMTGEPLVFTVLRFNPDGAPDDSFGVNGRVSTPVGTGWSGCTCLAPQRDGKIVAGGNAGAGGGNVEFALVRYLSDGALDPTFGSGGIALTAVGANGSEIRSVALQRDGKILAAGRVWEGTYSDFGVVRYDGDTMPWIISQPLSQVVTVGGTVSLAVEADGTPPLLYQWLHDGTEITGATGTTLTLTNVQPGNAGAYSVVVSNYLGSVTSSNALLTVNLPPTISISSPTNGTVMLAPAGFTLVADATDDLGIAEVEFWLGTNSLGVVAEAPWFILQTNLPAGEYGYAAVATDTFGLASTSAVSVVTVLSQLPVEVEPLTTDSVLVRQTGLFHQTVRVTNPTPAPIAALRLWVELDANSRAHGVQVWNATGRSNAVPYLSYNASLAPGQSIDLQVEYYVPDRRTFPNPVFGTEVVVPEPPFEPTGTVLGIARQVPLTDGLFLVEFSTMAGRRYYVQYSSDMTDWKTALPAVLGTGSRVQWIDNGPPKTESLPSSEPSRFYRVLLLP